ncbi:MAG: phospholipase D family protein [Actinobacteria bacterium]|nr:phospholipase D family protein [Actinomycetota bacterium]
MTYMDAMRPPPGFHLEKAVGTTFSAELEMLMLMPLALSSKDGFCDEDGRPNFLALLDSIRRTASKMVVFCQRGRVLLPKSLSKLNPFLNHSLFEISPPRGSFHPKTWLLHFGTEEGDELYRLICTSRNVTSSKSWDTMIVLDGERYEEESEDNRQLVDYLSWLSKQDCLRDEPEKEAIVRSFSREIRNVWFSDINPARECYFDYTKPDARNKPLDLEWLDSVRRLLVISPFLTQEQVEALAEHLPDNGGEGILVSSIDALKTLDWSSDALRKYSAFYWDDELTSEPEVIQEEIETPEESEERDNDSMDAEPTQLSGLHAKLYIAEAGDNVAFVTGSANATNAGFRGHNVEFVTILKGKRKNLGIDAILGTDEDAGNFQLRNFLLEFEPPDKPTPVDEEQQRMNMDLESARRALGKGEIVITVQKGEQSRSFDLAVKFNPSEGKAVSLPDGIEGQFWPASLARKTRGVPLTAFLNKEEVTFSGIGPGDISKFVAFELLGKREGVKETRAGFVLGGRFEGEPEGLEEMVVASLLDKPEKFYEYLWFLLLKNYVSVPSIMPGGGFFGTWKSGHGKRFPATPLFEDLLSRCVEDPSLVNDIDGLVQAFKNDDQAKEIIPVEFLRVWKEIKNGLTEAGP